MSDLAMSQRLHVENWLHEKRRESNEFQKMKFVQGAIRERFGHHAIPPEMWSKSVAQLSTWRFYIWNSARMEWSQQWLWCFRVHVTKLLPLQVCPWPNESKWNRSIGENDGVNNVYTMPRYIALYRFQTVLIASLLLYFSELFLELKNTRDISS